MKKNMLIEKIIEDDTRNCYEAVLRDDALSNLETRFYISLEDVLPDRKEELERVFSAYMARLTRIVYLQGMKDFTELHVMLKGDVAEIYNDD